MKQAPPPFEDPAAWIRETVRDFVAGSPANTLGDDSGEPSWGPPLVGFSRGDDPLYAQFKSDIGPFLWTPLEAFEQGYPDGDAAAGDLAVISYVLPQTAATRADQRRETGVPSERWTRSRHFGEIFNEELRRHLAEVLKKAGIPAAAPALSPLFDYRMSDRLGLASNWSERHAAYASGLGTFGLSDGLITARGKAMRCGSVVARIAIAPTPRPYKTHTDWCLYYARGTCGVCISRCPVGAITREGHDKAGCFKYIRGVTAVHARKILGIDATPCGLCQVAIPCESRNPLETTPAPRPRATTDSP
ncbi:4Fe-4S ferredoxin [uncultured Desulfuromonas sp.]|uniref:4Fe-4S ferredoxin n=1 Tax=uncultured Desulfuromonas sp. TaxID=181013 RepID=UPI002622C7C3|nr:4Fe-4S ferredoxin [uncultured Desulfuromonas sp.]